MGRGSRNSSTFWRDRYKRATFRIVTFKVDRRSLEVIDKAARALGFESRSELIRAALSDFLKRHGFSVPLDDWPVIQGRPLEVTLP